MVMPLRLSQGLIIGILRYPTPLIGCIPSEKSRDLHGVIFFSDNHICLDFKILDNPAVLGLLECCHIQEARDYLQWAGIYHVQLLLTRNEMLLNMCSSRKKFTPLWK